MRREKEKRIGRATQSRIWKEEDPCDFIPAEMSLERIAFFTPSANGKNYLTTKRISHQALTAEFSAPGNIGLPITIDQDYYRAFQKILAEHIDCERPLTEPVAVSTRRLLKYSNKAKSRHRVAAIKRWLRRMSGVLVEATLRPTPRGKSLTIRGTVFDTVLSPGEDIDDRGTIAETNYVWLSRWYVSSITQGYLRNIDLEFYNSLRKPLAKALYPLLQTGWYASQKKGSYYEKRYSHLCELFLLSRFSSLTRVRQQLEPALKELVQAGFLVFDLKNTEGYRRSKADPKDWVITFWPGPKYLEDRQRQKNRQELAKRIKASLKQHKIVETFSDKQVTLLEDILGVCKDRHSEAGYRKVITTYDEHLVRAALSETKLAVHQGTIRKSKGAYFMDTLKRLHDYRHGVN